MNLAPLLLVTCPFSFAILYLKIKTDDIDRDDGLPGIVLESASEESLREEEPRDPEDRRDAFGDPALDELHSLH
jgi:hypothetical protein